MRTVKTMIRLGAHVSLLVLSCGGSFIINFTKAQLCASSISQLN